MNNKTEIEKYTRLGLVGAVLLVAFSVFYYLVIYLPGKENQKIETQRLEVEQQKKEKELKQESLSSCLTSADESYTNNWNNECKSQGKLSDACIKLVKMTFDEYAKENNIPNEKRLVAIDEFYDKKHDCSCRLPTYNADTIEGWKKDAKDECYKRYN